MAIEKVYKDGVRSADDNDTEDAKKCDCKRKCGYKGLLKTSLSAAKKDVSAGVDASSEPTATS